MAHFFERLGLRLGRQFQQLPGKAYDGHLRIGTLVVDHDKLDRKGVKPWYLHYADQIVRPSAFLGAATAISKQGFGRFTG